MAPPWGASLRPAFTALAFVVGCGTAAPVAATSVADLCLARAQGVTVAVRACLTSAAQGEDRRLNAAYRKLSALLDAPVRARLVEAQRAWLAFRVKDCAFVGAREAGGSDAALAVDQCSLGKTRDRAAMLERLAADEKL